MNPSRYVFLSTMTDKWYYQFLDQEMGPVDLATLRSLVADGSLDDHDAVRAEGSDEWIEVNSIPGFIPDLASDDDLADMLVDSATDRASTRERRGTNCYCRQGHTEIGPISFEALVERARDGLLSPRDELRLSADADWIAAGDIVGLFDSSGDEVDDAAGDAPRPGPERPAEEASTPGLEYERDPASASESTTPHWHCRILGQPVGPLSFEDVRELAASGQLSRGDDVRNGESGEWVKACTISGLFPRKSRKPRRRRKKEFDVDAFLAGEEDAGTSNEERSSRAHVSPQRMPNIGAVGTAPAPNAADRPPSASSTHPMPVETPPSVAPIESQQPPTLPPPATESDQRPESAAEAPARRVAWRLPSFRNPFSGLGGSFGAIKDQAVQQWKRLAAVAALFSVAGVVHFGWPGNASRAPEVYQETLALWTEAQRLKSGGNGEADWTSFRDRHQPRVEQLAVELQKEASADDRLMQLMLNCYRDSLPRLLDGGPDGDAAVWDQMNHYMTEAAEVAEDSN